MLTVRDHILAGHYPDNEHGWALVPMRNGDTARVITAHGSEPLPLIGLTRSGTCFQWAATGTHGTDSGKYDLLPPAPRPAIAADFGFTEEPPHA